jgi:hypothetical protein
MIACDYVIVNVNIEFYATFPEIADILIAVNIEFKIVITVITSVGYVIGSTRL